MTKPDPFASLDRAFTKGGRDLLSAGDALPRIFNLRLDAVETDPDQPRKTFNDASIQELADSIEHVGIIQPIVVRKHPERDLQYVLVAGERRYRATQRLGWESIPAIRTDGNADEISLIENIQREDLRPLEEAEALARLMERHEYSQGDVAKVIGKSRISVNETLRLNSLLDEIKEGCRARQTPTPQTKHFHNAPDDRPA